MTDEERQRRLEDAFATASRLSERMDERFGKHESCITNIEDAIVVLTKLLKQERQRKDES
jgi:hypothetical protein